MRAAAGERPYGRYYGRDGATGGATGMGAHYDSMMDEAKMEASIAEGDAVAAEQAVAAAERLR